MDDLGWFKPLFEYPDETYRDRAFACAAVTGSPEIRALAQALAPLSLGLIQEAFIQAFDMNPNATLEIGWHLFGEQYERGEFLVNMRARLREAEIAECGELPDHLLHVLPLMARMADEDARAFAEKFVLPALAKIEAGLPKDSVFGALVRGLTAHLRAPRPSAFDAETAEMPLSAESAEEAAGHPSHWPGSAGPTLT